MVLVSERDIGRAAWGRMARDRTIVNLTDTTGLPADVAPTAALRALAISHWVPGRCAVTGASALWVWGFGPSECPVPLRTAVPRGRHPDPPPGHSPHTWYWFTDSRGFALARPVAGVLVVTPQRAIVVALRLDRLELALPSAAAALRTGACTVRDVDRELLDQPRAISGRARQLSAWNALKRIIREPGGEHP